MKNYLTALAVSLLCGVVFIAGNVSNAGYCNVTDVILYCGFSSVQWYKVSITVFIYTYIPLLLFQVLYGAYIYRHFCSAGIYIFSRNMHRVKWYLKESLKLYGFTVAYLILMVSAGVIVSGIFVEVSFNYISFAFMGYYVLIFSLFLFAATTAINLMAIRFSSNIAFIVVEGLCMLGMCIYTSIGEFLSEEYICSRPWIIKLNPMCHLLFMVHSSSIPDINDLINEKNIQFDLNTSVLFFLIVSLILLFIGCIVIKNFEFIRSEEKTEGV